MCPIEIIMHQLINSCIILQIILLIFVQCEIIEIKQNCSNIINNNNNNQNHSNCDYHNVNNTIILNDLIKINNNNNNNLTNFHNYYLKINNFTLFYRNNHQKQQKYATTTATIFKKNLINYNKNVNVKIRPLISIKNENYYNLTQNHKKNYLIDFIMKKMNYYQNKNNYKNINGNLKNSLNFSELINRTKKSPTSSSSLSSLSLSSSPSSMNNNNKSFSLVLVNHYKVSEVFESEFKNNINKKFNKNLKNHIENGKIVKLLGLFELSTKYGKRPEGFSELGAAQMAVKHINEKKLLPDYTLELITNDTQCDPGIGVDRFFHALYTQHSTRMIMLLGSACSEVTESLAKVVPYWNIVQVSFGSTSPALSDRNEFPFFYRTVAPDSSHNPARIAFIRKFGWDTVTTFSQNEEIYSLAVNDLVTELESANISCAATITFAETDYKEQLLLLRELDTRIIIGSFSQELAPKIFCEAYKLGMFGADYAWILHEGMIPTWWWNLSSPSNDYTSNNNKNKNNNNNKMNKDCLQYQLQEAVENLIIVSSHNSIVGNEVSYSGLSNEMFANQLSHHLNVTKKSHHHHQQQQQYQHHLLSRYAPQTYDAVWAIALALRGAEEHWKRESLQSNKLDTFDYTRYDMALEFLHQLGRLNFLGVSGPVSFSGPDRIGTSAFYQIQNGLLEPVALYYPSEHNLDFNCPNCKNIKWHSGQVPIAKRIFKLKVVTIAPAAFYTIATLASVGIALAIAFLAFNLHFRKLKAIKLSSPKLSNITAVGCILVYAAVVLLGLDYSTLPSAETSFSTICTARVYLLSAGFSLAFGSMFAKTYRVHRIFTHTIGSSICKDKMLQDTQLISLVCALLLLDGLVVTLWIVTDPIERHLNNLTLEISSSDRSVVYQPQVEVCRSQHTQSWLGALYVYKGLLLIVGVYMAWETRHVKISALNDSQYIGVSVYSVVITSAIVVVLANLISERVTLAFITITALILSSTTATLLLLFLPKLNDIWSRGDTIDPVIHSMGLKMECNTRRFVTDERRELQYRVEVQNRVYKKEIAALDAEIRRLEKLLESNSSTSSSNASLMGPQIPEVSVIAEALSGLVPPSSQPTASKSRTPSITGGLPYLLLSVLPPVIPRASWPSAEYMQVPMRRSVTFASHPQLEDASRSVHDVCLPAADLINLRLVHQQATETKTGIINKIRGMFVRSSGSKGSSNSISGPNSSATTGSIRAALKSHMGMITKFIPTAAETSASCNALYNVSSNMKSIEKTNLTKSGNDLNQETIENLGSSEKKLSTSLADEIDGSSNSKYVKLPTETRVSFLLPLSRRPSLASQPTLRERIKGSPRFPHRIIPTCSLSALEEKEKENNKLIQSTLSNAGRLSVSCGASNFINDTKSIVTITNNVNNKSKNIIENQEQIIPIKKILSQPTSSEIQLNKLQQSKTSLENGKDQINHNYHNHHPMVSSSTEQTS